MVRRKPFGGTPPPDSTAGLLLAQTRDSEALYYFLQNVQLGRTAYTTSGHPFGSSRGSIGRGLPEQVDRSQKSSGTAGREQLHPSSLRTLLDKAGLVKSLRMHRGCGHVDPALERDFVHAQTAPFLEQSDDFDSPMVGQSARDQCPSAFSVCHERKHAQPYILQKVKICRRPRGTGPRDGVGGCKPANLQAVSHRGRTRTDGSCRGIGG